MSIQSMTAYGYGEQGGDGLTYTCELRTLNSRYLEVSVRMPRHLLALEVDVINHVKAALKRGKADVFVDMVRLSGAKELPAFEPEALRHVLGLARRLGDDLRTSGLGVMPPPTFGDIVRMDGVMTTERGRRGPEAAETHRAGLFAALDRALAATAQARQKEGSALASAMATLLDDLEKSRVLVADLRDGVLAQLRAGVLKRVEGVVALLQKAGQAAAAPSDERLALEIATLSDKADIDEELTRLGTHIREFRRVMGEDEGAGRKLDFLCQEMHREVNTMSNKLVQTDVSQHTLELKQSVERLRQQVQNIE